MIGSLEAIGRGARESDAAKTRLAIGAARAGLKNAKDALLKTLDAELAVWESKLDVIFSEPAGREGMSRHAGYWKEKLENSI
ncbi:MAG: hypothetical protein HYT89_01205 [Candidatus Omnitrophica bacterium]|nr:hypothetical protein [Candidatus Omnitrophota bacterium]